jgi:GT2 family glycosyltransferase
MYPEDIDITRRIYSAGFRTVCYPEASVIHGHEQASAKKLRMLWVHVVNMIRYFNKWGWIFDSERRRINREIAELNKSKRLY